MFKLEFSKLQKTIIIALLLFVAFSGMFLLYKSKNNVQLTGSATFAQCLKDKGVKMYGASWCSHCQNQKSMFEPAAQSSIPYVECSPADQSPVKECTDANIPGYPTWIFPNGERIEGEATIQELSQKSGCQLD
jgi:hypothetical protein